MKELLNSKTFKKLCTGILPIAMLLVTLVPGSLWGTNYAAADDGDQDDTKSWVYALDARAGYENTKSAMSTSVRSMLYETSTYKDHTGNDQAKGTIQYKGEPGGERPSIVLSGVDVSTSVGLLMLNGESANALDDYDVELFGDNIITSTGESAIKIKDSKIRFYGAGTLTIYQSGGNPAIDASTTDSGLIIEDDDSRGQITVTIIQSGSDSPALVSKGNLEVNGVNGDALAFLDITQQTSNNAMDVAGDVVIKKGKVTVKHTGNSGNGLESKKNITISEDSEVTATVAKGFGFPITCSGAITIGQATVKAIGCATSPYGIQTSSNGKIDIDKNAKVEAYGGGQGAIEVDDLVIDPEFMWKVETGESAGSTNTTIVSADTLKSQLKNNAYKYVNMKMATAGDIDGSGGNTGGGTGDNTGGSGTNNNPGGSGTTGGNTGGGTTGGNAGSGTTSDEIPQTGDSTLMILPVLLMLAGALIVVVARKNTILEK